MPKMLNRLKGLIIDVDGTLFRGEKPLIDFNYFFTFLEKKGLLKVYSSGKKRLSKKGTKYLEYYLYISKTKNRHGIQKEFPSTKLYLRC